MLESAVVLIKVGIVCGVGFLVATGFEWFSDMEVKPRNKTVHIGQEKKKEVSHNDIQLEHLRKTARSRG